MGTSLPPAVVLNPYYTGIGIARCLRRHGVGAVGVYTDPTAPGRRSRHFQSMAYATDPRVAPDDYIAQLTGLLAAQRDKPVLFPTRDLDVRLIERYRSQLEPLCWLPSADAVSKRQLNDKHRLTSLAEACGLTVPRSRLCESLADVVAAAPELGFPLVLKPRESADWRQSSEQWAAVGRRKVILVGDAADLAREYEMVAKVCPQVVLQEYVPGRDDSIVVCGCHRVRGGITGYFTARKLRQNPPLTGTGCVVRLEHIPEIADASERLLSRSGYRGLAEVEFKQHADTGEFYLIEVNTRAWDQHELGSLAGVDLAWLAYQAARGAPAESSPAEPPERYEGVWVAERELLFQTASAARDRIRGAHQPTLAEKISMAHAELRDVVACLRAPRICGVVAFNDPLPSVLLIGRVLRELGLKLLQQK